MIKRLVTILLMQFTISFACVAAMPPTGFSDSSLLISKIRVTLINNRMIRGHIISYDNYSISIRSLSKKRGGKRIPGQIEIVPYDQIQSLKRLGWGFYVLMIAVGTGLTALTILVSKSSNTLMTEPGFVLFGPLLILAGLIGIFSRKKFRIEGKKDLYLQFISKLKRG
jgi:small nuclear ribonucleoprotein (snRNP)-like protein